MGGDVAIVVALVAADAFCLRVVGDVVSARDDRRSNGGFIQRRSNYTAQRFHSTSIERRPKRKLSPAGNFEKKKKNSPTERRDSVRCMC